MPNLFSRLLNKADEAIRRARALSVPPSPEALALEALNPLRGIGVTAAQDIFDAARRGNFATLGRVYAEIESADPTLLVVSERRGGALADLAWRMKDADGRAPGFDAGLAREQAAAAEGMLAGAENFGEAVEHLATAFFRGAALTQPRFLTDGTLVGFANIPTEMVCYDASRDLWQLNPDLTPQDPGPDAPGLADVAPEDGMVSVARRRHIDYPALLIYIRAALGERHWARFVDRFGLPPAVLTMPAMASKEEEAKFLQAAKAAADGRTVALPNGSGVTYAADARGVNPFSEYLRHQQELVVLMATGGLLTTLAESGSGTLAGNAHLETWRQVVRKDARIVGEAIQAQLIAPWLRRKFPDRPVCSVFDFDAEPAPTASEVLDDAVKARQAGYEIDAKELSEKTGYTLKAAPQAPAPGGFGGGGLALNRKTPLQFGCDPLQNARSSSDGKSPVPEAGGALQRVLEAFRSDLGPAAEELQRILALPEGEMRAACKDLADRLPDLLPADPAMAAILAEELAGAFAEAVGETTVLNARGGNPDNRGQFSTHEGPHGREPETKPHHDRYGSTDEGKLAANPRLNEERGMAALEEVMRKKGTAYVDKAMYREESGWIRFDWGDAGNPAKDHEGGHGLAHVSEKERHDPRQIPQLIARGVARKNPATPEKIYFVGEDSFCVVASLSHGSKRIITEFVPNGKKYAKRWAEIKTYPPAKRPGDN